MGLLLSSSLTKADNTNSIDIKQISPGDDITIDIIQSGYDNKILFSLGDVDNADLWIRQSGHNQEIGWVSWWGSGASWGGDIDYDDTELKLAQNCTKSAGNCNKNDIGFHISYGDNNTLWWGQGYYFSDRNDTTWTYDNNEGGGHTANFDIHGSNNSIKGYQRNCSAGACDGHTARIYLYGSNNDVFSIQDTDGTKELYLTINNSGNTVDTQQTGNADHVATITLSGSYGTDLDLIQKGNSDQSYTLIQSCMTFGGCNITIIQQ